MYLRSDERGPQMTNRLALRIGLFGGVALALLGLLLFRLWFVQVLNGKHYRAEANNNRTREYRISAPRGWILDRSGKVLVDNRTSLALQVNPRKLPLNQAKRRAELAELATLIHGTLHRVRRTMHEQLKLSPSAPVTVRRDVGHYLVFYLRENQDRFPGIVVQKVFVRHYPQGTMGAHVLGYVGEINEEELKEPRYRGLQPGDEIGKEGVENTYDRYLRGQPGLTKIQVDAMGEPTGRGPLVSKPPTPGETLKLTIDSKLQAAGEQALAMRGLPGGFITMDVHTGEVLALGSFPTFDPAEATPPLTFKQAEALYQSELAPLTDRAISGLYPTGSTFKLITAMAALNSGVSTPETVINDPGSITIGGQPFEDSEGVGHGAVNLVEALKVSSDVYFYTLGWKMWNTGALQHWGHLLGIGRPTGIDLPQAEGSEGTLPGKKWAEEEIEAGAELEPWGPGQNVQLATGQGYLQTDPLEMAVAYATVANGGTVVTPHVGLQIDDAAGRVLREFGPPPRRHVHVNAEYRAAILEGLHEAAQAPEGTSCSSFCGFRVPVAGKTGTAERVGHLNQSWYIVLAPYPNPRIVTAVTIEEGGFGAESAAPAAKEILETYFAEHGGGAGGTYGGSHG